jgi:glycerol-3-phosphate acyltransferase PlsY
MLVLIAAWVAAAYLLGSVPFGWLIGKARGVDIREHGSRNIGATNCGRVCGAPWGVLAFLLDAAKGFLPLYALAWWVLPRMMGQPGLEDRQDACLVLAAVAVAPILGHTFPVYLSFRGGKAVATSLGVVLALPMLGWVGLAAFGVWVAVFAASRYVSVASSAAAIAFAAGYLYLERRNAWGDYLPVTIFVLALVCLVLWRHRSNYARLWRGTENRFGSRPPAPRERI